ncbi:MAG: hypothetical protein E7Z87_04780 [Cyanobacteria bacterium SIG26]|nr:hypothetical protein [Cyanobacteria bacterium SIG26]
MDLRFDETIIVEQICNVLNDCTYVILAKDEEVDETELTNVIRIIDESGVEVSCTYDKFVEIFDKEGLAGFIM